MKSLEIKAIDTLFFKDGKPFSMGEETWAKGVFPPYPSTLFGLLNSIIVSNDLSQLSELKKSSDLKTGLEITGYLLVLDGKAAFHPPLDLYAKKGEKLETAYALSLLPRPDNLVSEYNYPYLMRTSQQIKTEDVKGKILLDMDSFNGWLNGTFQKFNSSLLSDYMEEEPKVGIGRDFDTRTASEGLLYRVAMKRLEGRNGKLSILIKYTLPDKLGNGLSRFGAENKAVEYVNGKFPNIPFPASLSDNRFKIYLATPAIFEEGAYPKKWFEEFGLKLLTASIGKPEAIGGFDIVARRPKVMRKAVPAGSVYYVQGEDNTKVERAIRLLHQGSIYNLAPDKHKFRAEYQKQGFGLTYVGKL